jgi:hypothetical protein
MGPPGSNTPLNQKVTKRHENLLLDANDLPTGYKHYGSSTPRQVILCTDASTRPVVFEDAYSYTLGRRSGVLLTHYFT